MEVTEGIYKAGVDKPTNPFPFLGQETAVLGVAYRIVNIYRAVTNIIVPAKDQVRAGFLQFFHVILEVFQPFHLECLPFISCRSGRMIYTYDRQVAVVGTNETSLVVVRGEPHPVFHVIRLRFREYRYPAISFFLG